MDNRLKLPILLACVLALSACSSQAVYTEESFADDSPFKMRVDGEVEAACEGARRSLLGQGYLIEHASSEAIKARKAIKREDKPNTFIEMNVVCLPESRGSTLFATGLLSTYSLKKSSSSASVGLSALGSISLPIGQSADSLVKVSEETIDDKDFYQRFFAAVSTIMVEMEDGEISAAAVAEAVLPEPGPEPEPETTPDTDTPQQQTADAAEPLPATSPEPAPIPEEPAQAIVPAPVPAPPTPASAPAQLPTAAVPAAIYVPATVPATVEATVPTADLPAPAAQALPEAPPQTQVTGLVTGELPDAPAEPTPAYTPEPILSEDGSASAVEPILHDAGTAAAPEPAVQEATPAKGKTAAKPATGPKAKPTAKKKKKPKTTSPETDAAGAALPGATGEPAPQPANVETELF